MIYPSQKKDFKIACPSCRGNDWLIKSNKEDLAEVQCKGCEKEYQLTFKKQGNAELRDKMSLFIGQTECPQCHSMVRVECTSKLKSLPITCKECNLEFTFNKSEIEQYKQISTICEILEEIEEPKEKEGEEEEVIIPEEIVKVVKEEEKKANDKKEAPSEVKTEPKVEKTEEVIVEPKAEKIEVTEPKAEKTEPVVELKKSDKEIKDTDTENFFSKEELETKKDAKEVTLTEKEKVTVKENLVKIDPKVMEDIEEASSDIPVAVPIDTADPITEFTNEEPVIEEAKTEVPVIVKSTKSLRRAVKKNKVLKNEIDFNLVTSKAKKEALVTAIKKTVSQVISLKEEMAKIKRESRRN